MNRYNPKDIEAKWQKQWAESKLYEVTEDPSKEKIYAAPMLPYPSGAGLHTGHVRNYSIADAVARFHRQKGYNVLSAIGWDSFGLPAENYAIKTGTPPAESTAKNIAYFKEQLQRIGASFDWNRELNTSDPSYYKWTQWVFGLLYKRGLAYKAEKSQWWCEKCNTVLADEQVINGKCWRHEGADDPLVTKRDVSQWFFKLTEYADDILNSTDALEWPEKIKTMQKNWIGRSEGAIIDFSLSGLGAEDAKLEVFTTACHTLFGVSFIVLAPEHPLVSIYGQIAENAAEIDEYVQHAQRKSEIDREANKIKTGVALQGLYAINPINNEKVPVWVADYVLMGYGTGAVMGVPAHDERDFDFARKYDLPIPQVVMTIGDDPQNPPQDGFKDVERPTVIVHLRDKSTGKFALLNWHGSLSGITTAIMGGIEEGQSPEDAVRAEIKEEAGLANINIINKARWLTGARYCASHKNENRKAVAYGFLAEVENLKDQAGVSDYEQKTHTLVWVDEKEVATRLTPVHQKQIWDILRNDKALLGDGELINSGEYNGLSVAEAKKTIAEDLIKQGKAAKRVNFKVRDWLISRQRYWGAPVPIVYCPDHGAVLVPESQLPVELPKVENYVPDGKNSSVLAGVEDWVNTTCPECGGPAKRETDTMDGYVCSTWYLQRYTDAHNIEKPFDPAKTNYWYPLDFYFGGDHAVAHLLYIRFFQRVLVDAGLAETKEPVKRLVYNGYINAEDGRKMSKSLGNTVDPMDVINQGYGADALRVFELFIAPYDQDTPWNSKGVPGTYRFLNRVWTATHEYAEATEGKASEEVASQILRAAHKSVKKVTDDLTNLSFNTAVAAMMDLTNQLYLLKAKEPIVKDAAWQYAVESLVQILAPFAPHITEELWHTLGHTDSVHKDHWPEYDEKYLVSDTMTIAVQVNGKVRAEINVPSAATKEEVIAAGLANENIQKYLQNKEPAKTIYVPGRILNFVG